jgi:hypothetical protein
MDRAMRPRPRYRLNKRGSRGFGALKSLIAPTRREVWASPQNDGFEREAIICLLEELGANGHDYELIDGDALSGQERSELYGQAVQALAPRRQPLPHPTGLRQPSTWQR